MSTMPVHGSFCAEDGYGNYISSAVTCRYTRSETIPSKVHYVFKVTNMFNDSVSAEADFTISDPRPLITLTENSVTVRQGEAFTPEAYISSAIDVDGSSLLQAVTIQGPLNIDEPGTYTFTYSVTGADGRSSLPAKLNVTVESQKIYRKRSTAGLPANRAPFLISTSGIPFPFLSEIPLSADRDNPASYSCSNVLLQWPALRISYSKNVSHSHGIPPAGVSYPSLL